MLKIENPGLPGLSLGRQLHDRTAGADRREVRQLPADPAARRRHAAAAAAAADPRGQEGAGQWLLPVTEHLQPRRGRPAQRHHPPARGQRLTIILNELGAGLAGRGSDLNAVLHRSNPALRELEKVIGDLRLPEQGARRTSRSKATGRWPRSPPYAAFAEFLVQGNTVAAPPPTTAARSPRTSPTSPPSCASSALPQTPRPVRRTDHARPSPTSASRPPASTDLQEPAGRSPTARRSSSEPRQDLPGPRLRRSPPQPLLGQRGDTRRRGQAVREQLLRTAHEPALHGRPGALLDLIFLGGGASNGYDSLGHFLRAEIIAEELRRLQSRSPAGLQRELRQGGEGSSAARRAPRRT